MNDTIINEYNRIVYGGHRYVIVSDHSDVVIKIPLTTEDEIYNKNEWLSWILLKDTELGKFLIPCVRLEGSILIQKKIDYQFDTVDDLLKYMEDNNILIPKYFTKYEIDFSISNTGIWNNQLVFVDYHNFFLYKNRRTSYIDVEYIKKEMTYAEINK